MQLRIASEDEETRALVTSSRVRRAAAAVIITGFVCAMAGLRLLISVRFFSPWLQAVPWTMALLGLTSMYVGTALYRMRSWAAHTAIASMALFAGGGGAFELYSVAGGIFSLLGLLVPFGALLALVLTLLARADCIAADKMRTKMSEEGMDLGI